MKLEDIMEALSTTFLPALLPIIQEVCDFWWGFYFPLPLRVSEIVTSKILREYYNSNTLNGITIAKKNSSKLPIS